MIFGHSADKIRKDFPMLSKPIIYFDNACMSLKPIQVINKIDEYYKEYTACAGRSAHKLARRVEEEVDKSRNEVRNFINAKHSSEIIFTRNTTEGINLVANSLGLKNGDEVIISGKEHNSNLLPWLKLGKKGVKVKVVESNTDNTFNLENFSNSFTETTKLVSIVHTSNLDGVTNPIGEIARIAHKHEALLLVDAAQSVPHKETDVRNLDADFMAFSGHKMLGPTGTGVLYGKKELLENMEQFIIGGETVIDSTYDGYKIEALPMRFEAGLQDYAGIIGLGEACIYLKKIGMRKVAEHDGRLNKLITECLTSSKKINLIGPQDAEKRSGIFSFNIDRMDPNHVSRILDASKNIMTRSGAHCVHSWFNNHNLKGSVRASLYLYNTEEEAQIFVSEIKKLLKI
ncbi:MAG: cysteine desulfurase [Nanoarchaeota archaeon]